MPLVLFTMSHAFADGMGITPDGTSHQWLEDARDRLPNIVAPILNSKEHLVSAADIEIWPQILHPLARTRFDVAIDIFTACDDEREADCQRRSLEIKRALAMGFFPSSTEYCCDIHLDIEGFAIGTSL